MVDKEDDAKFRDLRTAILSCKTHSQGERSTECLPLVRPKIPYI
jgi:hypothetical protein